MLTGNATLPGHGGSYNTDHHQPRASARMAHLADDLEAWMLECRRRHREQQAWAAIPETYEELNCDTDNGSEHDEEEHPLCFAQYGGNHPDEDLANAISDDEEAVFETDMEGEAVMAERNAEEDMAHRATIAYWRDLEDWRSQRPLGVYETLD